MALEIFLLDLGILHLQLLKDWVIHQVENRNLKINFNGEKEWSQSSLVLIFFRCCWIDADWDLVNKHEELHLMKSCDATQLAYQKQIWLYQWYNHTWWFTDYYEKQDWDRCNIMVISWIVNNVSKELVSGILFCSNASVVWRDLKERFDKVNMSRIYHLHKAITT